MNVVRGSVFLRVEIRPMRVSDVDDVTVVHLESFPRFFLSFLGRRFLRELYNAILADEEGIAFVGLAEGKVIGFVAGSGSSAGFYRRAARGRWWRFGLASFGAILRRPSIAPPLLPALYAPPQSAAEGALLMSLAVSPRVQRSGAGKLLARAFVDEAARRGAKAVILTTDQAGNDQVNAFYRSFGFQLAGQRTTPEGRVMNEYVLQVSPHAESRCRSDR